MSIQPYTTSISEEGNVLTIIANKVGSVTSPIIISGNELKELSDSENITTLVFQNGNFLFRCAPDSIETIHIANFVSSDNTNANAVSLILGDNSFQNVQNFFIHNSRLFIGQPFNSDSTEIDLLGNIEATYGDTSSIIIPSTTCLNLIPNSSGNSECNINTPTLEFWVNKNNLCGLITFNSGLTTGQLSNGDDGDITISIDDSALPSGSTLANHTLFKSPASSSCVWTLPTTFNFITISGNGSLTMSGNNLPNEGKETSSDSSFTITSNLETGDITIPTNNGVTNMEWTVK